MPEHGLSHEHYMRRCIELARRARASDDAPVGALVVKGGRIVGEGVEGVRARRDVTAHAEIEALRAASRTLDSVDLSDATLYTSVEPCVMCAYAIRLARIGLLVTGAPGSDAGRSLNGSAILSSADLLPSRPVPAITRGVLMSECQAVLQDEPAAD